MMDSITGSADVFSAAAEIGADMVKDGLKDRVLGAGEVARDIMMDTAGLGIKTTGNILSKVVMGNRGKNHEDDWPKLVEHFQ